MSQLSLIPDINSQVVQQIQRDALFSACGKYRYWLSRVWDGNKRMVLFIGLNPSTANHEQDDPTIRRVISMAKSWGYGGVLMMNCFAFVSTDPNKLLAEDNRENLRWLKNISRANNFPASGFLVDMVVFAWGNFKIVKETGMEEVLLHLFPEAAALVINKNGSPRHPLYVPANVKPVIFKEFNAGL